MVGRLKALLAVLALAAFLFSCAVTEEREGGTFVNPLDAARALADTWMSTYPPEDASWSWDSGVLMLGIWDLYKATGEAKYRDYVKRWIDHHIENGYVIAFNDHVPPALIALRLWVETGDEAYRKVVDDAKEYIFVKAARLPDGGLNHMGWYTGNQIWVDTLFMVVPFLVEAGRLTNDYSCFEEAVLQFEVFAKHLRDADTGLYRHMYDADTGEVAPPEPDYWGRGNGWVVAASGIALGLLPKDQEGYEAIRDRFIQQVRSMAKLMDPSGRWHTIMNRDYTYLETSAGLLFSFGVYKAASAGAADEEMLSFAERALGGGLDQIVVDENGDSLLLGTSYGTAPNIWAMYEEVLKGEQVSYGIGALLLAAAARVEWGDTSAQRVSGKTDETYIHQPTSDDLVEWGYFYLARGDISRSLESFSRAVEMDGLNSQASFGSGLVDAIGFALDALDVINGYTVGAADLTDVLSFLKDDGRGLGQRLVARMQVVEQDLGFARKPERIVIITGGSTALGSVELDLGEAYVLDAIGHLLWGIGDLTEGMGVEGFSKILSDSNLLSSALEYAEGLDKLDLSLIADGLDHIATALGVLATGITEIDSETDDQSDDLLPANLFCVEGAFYLPGIMLPTPVEEIWGMLGIDPFEFFGSPMPDALIDWLLEVKGYIEFLRDLISGF